MTTDLSGRAISWSTPLSNNSLYGGTRAFDNDAGSGEHRWLAKFTPDTDASGMYVVYEFYWTALVDAIGVLMPGSEGPNIPTRAPNTWTFSGSMDGVEWTVLDSQEGETGWTSQELRYYKFDNNTKYRYYRFKCTALNGATDALQIKELRFYGQEPVEEVPATATWTGGGTSDSLDDTDNWTPSIPGPPSMVYMGTTGEAAAGEAEGVVPAGATEYSSLVLGNNETGNGATGTIWQTQGTMTINAFTIGRFNGGVGRYCISGGTLNAPLGNVQGLYFLGARAGGYGLLDISGSGTVNITSLAIGQESRSFGCVNVSGNGVLTVSTALRIGYNNTCIGEVNQTGGTVRLTGTGVFYIGENGSGTYMQTAGSLSVPEDRIFVGYGNTSVGKYQMTGGTCTAKYFNIGGGSTYTGSTGDVFLSGTGKITASDEFEIGRVGKASLDVSGSGEAIMTGNSGIVIAKGAASVGSLNLHDGGKMSAKKIVKGSGTVRDIQIDGGVIQARENNAAFFKDFDAIALKSGGLTIDSQGHNLGITNCTFNVTPNAKITVAGGGTMTFVDMTVSLASRPTAKFTFAETDGVFSGMPALSGAKGVKIKMSADRKRIDITPAGLLIIVK